jgi:hypothetical protein
LSTTTTIGLPVPTAASPHPANVVFSAATAVTLTAVPIA